MNQSLPLVEQLKNLEHLQLLDLKIDSIKKNQGSLPSELKSIDLSLSELKQKLAEKQKQVLEVEQVHRQAKAAMELNQDRLTRSSAKLEGVQNSQEFQAVTKEIEQIKKLNATLQEQDEKAVQDLEVLGVEAQKLSGEVEKVQSERNSQAGVLLGQEDQLKTDIFELISEREKYTCNVEPRILAQYDRVRSARSGLGIVSAQGGQCKGCNMMVPPQLYNEVQRASALHACPSCHRILYIPENSAQ